MADRGDASSSLSINVQELEKSMKKGLRTFGKTLEKEEPCTIYKMFGTVREEHKKDYTPQIIAIGPFHRNNNSLKKMEPLKWMYLQQLIERKKKKNTLQNYINTIGEAVTEARSYYSEEVELDDDEFVEMMVLDGGFLIEYLVKAYTGDLNHLSKVNWTLPLFRSDLLLLENQFPFPILQRLFNSSDIPVLHHLEKDGNPITLTELAVNYVTRNKPQYLPEASRPESIYHLLHVYHASIHPTPQRDDLIARACCGYATVSTMKWMKSLASAPFLWLLSAFLNCHIPLNCRGSCRRSSKEKKSRAPRGIQTATQLRDSGVQFMTNKKNTVSFLDVRFNKEAGVMEIPMLSIQEATISQFRNLIAFEQCCPKAGSHFTSHATLMNNLIDTPMDVAILKDARIIESKLGEDKEVAKLFNNLCKGAYLNYDEHHNHKLFEDVVAYSNIDRHKWRAGLMHDYFSNPWAIISLVAAFFLVCLTVVQTFYAVYAYHRPPPNGN
ncbi:Uncharacterized protein M6B38_231400 [Iris pallida]|uniref:Uncharacterized protein n=1 Tax=Iris pallida TaxID=29817 RepID=A0AAX6DME3_IRIPA|nr:Uncharacterized protein M6B38_237900 [Iris pallida]KAJ6794214.1 Uncharacterized protein M6B38_231400 [Iris pallida]